MVSEAWMAALVRAGAARAEAARIARTAALADEITAAFDGDVAAQAVGEGVRLTGRGPMRGDLAARMFGSRQRGPDPRLIWLATWLAMGGY